MRDSTEPDDIRPADHPALPDPAGGVLTGYASLPADRAAAARARALTASWLTGWWGPRTCDSPERAHLRDRLELVLSELVSNAVVHSRPGPGGLTPALEVELHEFAHSVRLVVADHSRGPDQPAFRPATAPTLPAPGSPSGRGLFLVDRLADIWQAQPVSDGLVVWCDFALVA